MLRSYNDLHEIFDSLKIYGIWPQASKDVRMYVNTLPQCSPASVGLAQARPNNYNISQNIVHCNHAHLILVGCLPMTECVICVICTQVQTAEVFL